MNTKQIIGFTLLGASMGMLSFIYFGYLKPRLEVDAEIKAGQTKPATTQETKT